MPYKFIPFFAAMVLTVSFVAAATQDCPALVENALSRAQTACAVMRGNQACYGYQSLEAQLQEGLSPFAFNAVGDITPVDTIESLHMSALNPVTDEWGVSLLRVRADISPDQPNENVTMLAFGAVSLDPDVSGDYQPMQAFAFRTGDAESGCTDITENGLIIQTPEGVGRVTLWINDVRVRIGSTVLFQAEQGGDLIVSTFEGHAEVESQGETQEATTGMRVRVPLDDDMQPSAPPTVPEAFDMASAGIGSLIEIATSYTDGSVMNLISSEDSSVESEGAVNNVNNGSGGESDQRGNCNRDNGQGDDNGNCFGHDNGNNGQGNGNDGGNGGGNGNGKNG